MLTLSGTPDLTPFGEFTISPIHYIYTLYITEFSVLGLCLRINDSGLFAWISLTYFIYCHLQLVIIEINIKYDHN